MKKVIPNGTAIKQLREQLVRTSTQKEFAPAIAVSIRMLRKIENENQPISVLLLDRIAKLFGVRREMILVSPDMLAEPAPHPTIYDEATANLGQEQLIPRHDWDFADATSDEGKLYDGAARAYDLGVIIETPLNEEASSYAQELFDILTSLTWSHRDISRSIAPLDEVASRRRIRQLIVLLRGNDVWIYQTRVDRRLPERYDIPPEHEPTTYQSRFMVALGPPGEYGETTMREPIDHGQPFILPAWETLVAKQAAASC